MKRFLLLFFSVVLVCSVMVVPAFAAEYMITTELDGASFAYFRDVDFFSGSYTVLVRDLSNNDVLHEIPVMFNDYGVGDYEIICDNNSGSYALTGVYDTDNCIFLLYGVFMTCNDLGQDCVAGPIFYDGVSVELVPVGWVPDPEPVQESILSGVFGVFGGVGAWIAGQLGTTTSLFWNGQSLTFLGVLSVCALALAVILLLVMVVVRFLRFRG